jgi:hypothetical protein
MFLPSSSQLALLLPLLLLLRSPLLLRQAALVMEQQQLTMVVAALVGLELLGMMGLRGLVDLAQMVMVTLVGVMAAMVIAWRALLAVPLLTASPVLLQLRESPIRASVLTVPLNCLMQQQLHEQRVCGVKLHRYVFWSGR